MRPNPQETTDLVTFTEEILNGKLHLLCSVVHVPLTLFKKEGGQNPKLLNLNQSQPFNLWKFLLNSFKTEVMITSLVEMLKLPIFGQMATFTSWA